MCNIIDSVNSVDTVDTVDTVDKSIRSDKIILAGSLDSDREYPRESVLVDYPGEQPKEARRSGFYQFTALF